MNYVKCLGLQKPKNPARMRYLTERPVNYPVKRHVLISNLPLTQLTATLYYLIDFKTVKVDQAKNFYYACDVSACIFLFNLEFCKRQCLGNRSNRLTSLLENPRPLNITII